MDQIEASIAFRNGQGQRFPSKILWKQTDSTYLPRGAGRQIHRKRGRLQRRSRPTPRPLRGRESTLPWTPSPRAGGWLRPSRRALCGPPSVHSTTSYTAQSLRWRPGKCWASCCIRERIHTRKSEPTFHCLNWRLTTPNIHPALQRC